MQARHTNHSATPEYRLDPAVRRLNSEEKRDVMRFIRYGTPTDGIRVMVREEFHKYVTRGDINRLRCEIMDTAVPGGTWSDLEALIRQGGRFCCTRDDQGRIDCISFCRKEQVDIFRRYPEVVCMDATYNVNRSRFCLLQMVVTDGLGHGRCVMYSLMRNEKCGTYVTALLDFRDFMGSADKLQTFVVDMSFAQMGAIKTVFPTKKILVCTFHMIRAVHRKCKNRVVWHMVKLLVNTNSIARFTGLCTRLRRKFPRFYIYFCRVWLKHAHRWAACYGQGTVCLGNRTNNRAESAHRWLKRDLYAGDSLLKCCKRIWLSSHQMLVDYMCDAALSRIRRPVVSFNNPVGAIAPALTRYAVELVLKDWDCSKNPMSVVESGSGLKVTEQVLSRRLAYKVDLSKPLCTCMFNQIHAMPCRHLVFACMHKKLPLDKLINNSRWLAKKLDGVEPPELCFVPQPLPERHTCELVAMMRRANSIRRSIPPAHFQTMLDKLSTILDAFEVAVIHDDHTSTGDSPSQIPPLRERILQDVHNEQPTTQTTTTIDHYSTQGKTTTMHGTTPTMPTTSHRFYIPKVPSHCTQEVDLDDEDMENRPPT